MISEDDRDMRFAFGTRFGKKRVVKGGVGWWYPEVGSWLAGWGLVFALYISDLRVHCALDRCYVYFCTLERSRRL